MREKFFALTLKLTRRRDYEAHNPEESRKEHKVEPKEDAAKDTADEQREEDSPVPLVTHVNSILHSFFPMLRCTSTSSKITIEIDCMRTSPIYPTTSREPFLSTRDFCIAKDMTKETPPMRSWKLPCPKHFSQGE